MRETFESSINTQHSLAIAHCSGNMRVLEMGEIEQVNGGVLILAPAVISVAKLGAAAFAGAFMGAMGASLYGAIEDYFFGEEEMSCSM